MSKTYNWYPPQAKTRDQVIGAMVKKRRDLLKEAKTYDAGLQKIERLHEKQFYEILITGDPYWSGGKALPGRVTTYFTQCWKFGRDHVEFRVFASDQENPSNRLSLHWASNWQAIPLIYMSASLYLHMPYKSSYYTRLLQGKIKWTTPVPDVSTSAPIAPVQVSTTILSVAEQD
jgi:hypothetical protein